MGSCIIHARIVKVPYECRFISSIFVPRTITFRNVEENVNLQKSDDEHKVKERFRNKHGKMSTQYE